MRAQVLSEVGALGGTDLEWPEPVGDDRTVPFPPMLGHEGAGVVEAVGPLVRDVAVGTHVALVPESAALAVDPRVPPGFAALIGCSVAAGVGAVLNTARVRPEENAVVIGWGGGVGQAIILGLRPAGAYPSAALDPSPARREYAQALGAHAIGEGADGGFDHAFEAVGVDFPRLAQRYVEGQLPLDLLVGRTRPLDEAADALGDLRDAIGRRTVLRCG